jgi:hypothetical protein
MKMKKLLVRLKKDLLLGICIKVFLLMPVAAGNSVPACDVSAAEKGAPELCGAAAQGGLVYGHAAGLDVYVGGEKVSMNDFFVVGLDRDAPNTLRLKFCKDGGCDSYSYPIAERKYKEQKISVPKKFVEYDSETKKRINRESAEITSARKKSLSDTSTHFTKFSLPKGLASYKTTGEYGAARVYNNGKLASWHGGTDWAAPVGTPVYPFGAGSVVLVGDHYLNGKIVMISHGHGVTTAYLHLDRILVKAGDKVNRKTKIAESGNTGRSSGAHLHVQADWMNGSGKNIHIDQMVLLRDLQNVRH